MAAGLRVLSVAAATGRVGYTFLIGGRLCDWGLSRKASRSPEQAEGQVRHWIAYFRPDVVVTEKVEARTRKGEKTKRLIEAVAKVGRDANSSMSRSPASGCSRTSIKRRQRLRSNSRRSGPGYQERGVSGTRSRVTSSISKRSPLRCV